MIQSELVDHLRDQTEVWSVRLSFSKRGLSRTLEKFKEVENEEDSLSATAGRLPEAVEPRGESS